MSEQTTQTVKDAMEALRKFWEKPMGNGILAGINPNDLDAFQEELGKEWWKNMRYRPFVAELNGFDWDDDEFRKQWKQEVSKESFRPIPAHAFFGDATKAEIVILGINPQFDPIRDRKKHGKVDYNAFKPWEQAKSDSWDWHGKLWSKLKEWTCWGDGDYSKLFQLESFPYATHGKNHIPKQYRDGKCFLPSQILAAKLLSSMLNNNRKFVCITTNPVLEFWKNALALKEIKCKPGEIKKLEKRVLIVKSGLVKNSSLKNLCTLDMYQTMQQAHKKLSDDDREEQLEAVKQLLRDQGLLRG